MVKLSPLVGLVLLAGCAKAPASNEQQLVDAGEQVAVPDKPQDPNTPDSFGVVKVCRDGTKIYLLTGGAASGQYAIWNEQWELLAAGTSPDSVCSSN